MGGEDNVIGRFIKKILYIGAFAFILNSFDALVERRERERRSADLVGER